MSEPVFEILPFSQWQATRQCVTPEQFEADPDTSLGYTDLEAYNDVNQIHVYHDCLSIEERKDGTYHSIVLQEEFISTDLSTIEAWLYATALRDL